MPNEYVPLSGDASDHLLSKTYPNGAAVTLDPHSGEYSYRYGPTGLKGLLHTKYAVLSALFASIGGMTFGYDQGVIANVLVMKDFKSRFPLSPFQVGLLTAVLELGALFGALEAGILADKLSRRRSIVIASAVFCVGSLFQTIANDVGTLMLGRAIGGIGIGAMSMLCPLYISEMASPETRGSLVSLEQFSIVLGVVLGFWVGFFTRSINGALSWRIPLGIQIAPGIILALGTFWLPPSPRHLVLNGKEERALETLARLRDRDENDQLIQLELAEMRVETRLLKAEDNTNGGRWRDLFGPGLINRTMIGILVMFFQQWSGINSLLYYGPILMANIGPKGDTISLVMSGFINVVQLLAVIPAFFLLDSVGRKPLLQVGSLIMAFSHFSVAALVLLGSKNWDEHQGLAWGVVAMIYVFTASYGVSFGPVAWVLPTEVFPLSLRSKGAAISTASNWFNNFLVGLITPPLIAFTPPGTFAILALACSAAFVWTVYSVPETKGLSLEEIDDLFSSSLGQAEVARRKRVQDELGLHDLVREIIEME